MKSDLKFASYFNWLWTLCPLSDTKYISFLIIAIMLTHVLVCGAGDLLAACDNPELTNTTWEQIKNLDAVGWSAEKLREACEYAQTIDTAATYFVILKRYRCIPVINSE